MIEHWRWSSLILMRILIVRVDEEVQESKKVKFTEAGILSALQLSTRPGPYRKVLSTSDGS